MNLIYKYFQTLIDNNFIQKHSPVLKMRNQNTNLYQENKISDHKNIFLCNLNCVPKLVAIDTCDHKVEGI